MSTNQSTIDYILDQLQGVGEVRARKMFGEYALYCDNKVVALVCDEQLFVKITEAGKEYVGKKYLEGKAYPGAKTSMLIEEELIEDREWLQELIRVTANSLPMPKPKRIIKK
jgi:TfoX/Sxy family transcriptional regulator of competence genes